MGLPRSRLAPWLLLVVVLSVLTGAMLLHGAPVITTAVWDNAIPLDAGWRILNGQVPHVDFLMPVGLFTSYIAALGMFLTKASIFGLVVGNLCLMCVVVPVAAWVTARRTTPWLAVGLTLLWALMIIAPRPIGAWYRSLSFAMLYNRQGEVLLSILYVLIFLPRRASTSRTARWTETGLAGLLVVLLLHSKVNYGGLAVAALAFACVFRRRNVVDARAALVLTAAWALTFAVVAGLSPIAVYEDYVRSIFDHANTGRARHFLLNLVNQWWLIPLVFGAAYLAPPQDRKERRLLWLTSAFVLASSLGLLWSNMQWDEAPLIAVLLPFYWSRSPTPSVFAPPALVVLTLLAVVPGRTLHADAVSCAYSVLKRSGGARSEVLADTKIADFIIDAESLPDIRGRMDAGVMLLEQAFEDDPGLRSRIRLAVAQSTDPYTFALGLPPVEGGCTWRMLGDLPRYAASLSRYSHALVPRSREDLTSLFMDGEQFRPVASNVQYTLYEIRPR